MTGREINSIQSLPITVALRDLRSNRAQGVMTKSPNFIISFVDFQGIFDKRD
jgi:hypothetical protein